METIAEANFMLNTRLEYVTSVSVDNLEDVVYVDMKSSASSKINNLIQHFMSTDSEVAVFAVRKDTSTNLIVLGAVRGKDVSFVPGEIESFNGKFYMRNKLIRIKLKQNTEFNFDVTTPAEFFEKVKRGSGLGLVCPKMSFGKMPFVRGLISLFGVPGSHLAGNGNFNIRHSGCFIKIQ